MNQNFAENEHVKKISWDALLECICLTCGLLYFSLLALKLDHEELLSRFQYTYIAIFLGISLISLLVVVNRSLAYLVKDSPTLIATVLFFLINVIWLLLLIFLTLVHLKMDLKINISYDYIFIPIYPLFFFYLIVFCFAIPGFYQEGRLLWKMLIFTLLYSISFLQFTATLNYRLSNYGEDEGISLIVCVSGLMGSLSLNFLVELLDILRSKAKLICRAVLNCGVVACFLISLVMITANLDKNAALPWKLVIGIFTSGITGLLYGLILKEDSKISKNTFQSQIIKKKK